MPLVLLSIMIHEWSMFFYHEMQFHLYITTFFHNLYVLRTHLTFPMKFIGVFHARQKLIVGDHLKVQADSQEIISKSVLKNAKDLN